MVCDSGFLAINVKSFMKRVFANLVVFASLCVPLAGMVGDARAQTTVCAKLSAQLQSLEQAGNTVRASGATLQYQRAIEQQRVELDRTMAYARSLGCGGRVLIFDAGPAACLPLNSQIRSMQANIAQLQAQLDRVQGGSSSVAGQRAQIVAALQEYACDGYAQQPRNLQPQQQAVAPPQERRAERPQNFFGWLFGGEEEMLSDQYARAHPSQEDPNAIGEGGGFGGSGYRTLCVRMCDGYYFPVNFSTSSAQFERDERLCQSQCPGTEVALYVHRNPGQEVSEAVSLNGQSYSGLPNAFRYRQSFDSSCSCRGANQSWLEALAGADNNLGQRGDIVVTEKKSDELARPKGAQASAAKASSPAASPASLPQLDGPRKQVAMPDGSKKTIRLVGPLFFPAQ